MGRGGDDKKLIAGGCVCCVLLITSITLIAVSFSSLDPVEMGLEYNANTLTLNEDELFDNGLYFLGVGHSFFKFPKSLQAVKFSVATGNPIVVSLGAVVGMCM